MLPQGRWASAFWFLLGVGCSVAVWELRSGRQEQAGPVAATRVAAASAVSSPAALSERTLSIEAQVDAFPLVGFDGRGSDPRRAALIRAWLQADRKAAMQYLAKGRFRDLAMPVVARAVGIPATADELLEIANGAQYPWDAINAAGKWARPDVVNAFADLMPSVNQDAAGNVASAVASLLADLNLDRSVAFAMGLPSDDLRAKAIAGVFDSLRSGANGEPAVLSLYSTLPPEIQTSDPVLFSYGNAIWGSDPAAALQALESIADPKTRGMALITLSRNAASASPETAIAAVYAAPGMSDQAIYNHVSQILQNWSAVDPQAAANFLATTQIIPGSQVSKYSGAMTPPHG